MARSSFYTLAFRTGTNWSYGRTYETLAVARKWAKRLGAHYDETVIYKGGLGGERVA